MNPNKKSWLETLVEIIGWCAIAAAFAFISIKISLIVGRLFA